MKREKNLFPQVIDFARREQFQIFYRLGADHLEYQPDFVAETADAIYMLEPKASNQLSDPIVLDKKKATVK